MTQNPDAPYWTDSPVDVYTPLDQVEWRHVDILDYRFELPLPLAFWDVFSYWERERFHSMRDNLTQGDVLFDVGTEQGWCNLLYADMVGPENMVLIEPSLAFWPNIRATWERNYRKRPKLFYQGLLGDETTDDAVPSFGWPGDPKAPLIDRNKYQYIHEHAGIPQMRLDDLVSRSGVEPDALTLDVEGAELLVLQGATRTLTERHPKVWVSIHPDLGLRDYGVRAEQVVSFMEDLDYTATHLATDHEEHWMFL